MKRLALSLILALATVTATARVNIATPRVLTDAQQDLLRRASTIQFRALLEKGIDRIGDFDLQTFIDESAQVKFQDSLVELNTQGRFGFRYDRNLKLVTVAQNELQESSNLENQLLLAHEALGALGYQDQAYEISATTTAFLSTAASHHERLAELKSIAAQLKISSLKPDVLPETVFRPLADWQQHNVKFYEQLASAGGGSSEGGHGGDPTGAKLKATLISRLLLAGAPVIDLNFVIQRLDFEEYEAIEGQVCPYDEASFKQFAFIEERGDYIVVRLPNDCRNTNYMGQMLDVVKRELKAKYGKPSQ